MIRSSALAAVAAIALAACGGHGVVPAGSTAFAPQGSSPFAPMTANQDDTSPLALKTCATDPPQWMWIFKGACAAFTLKNTGGKFALGAYENVTVTGSIGYNNAKGSVTVDLADAIDKNGDVLTWKGKTFPPYKGKGTTVVYAVADNQTTQTIHGIVHKNVPILKYVVTDSKGLPGKSCSVALLAAGKGGKLAWTVLPSTFPVKGKTVTITQYTVPGNFALPPKGTGLYFGINCF